MLVGTVAAFSSEVTVTNLSKRFGPASARSLTAVTALAARRGDSVRIAANGPDAVAAVRHSARSSRPGSENRQRNQPPRCRRRASGPRPLGVSAGRVAGPVALDAAAGAGAGCRGPDRSRPIGRQRPGASMSPPQRWLSRCASAPTGSAAPPGTCCGRWPRPPPIPNHRRRSARRARAGNGRCRSAAWEAVEATAAVFSTRGDLLAARIIDLRDVRDRIIAQLSGLEAARGAAARGSIRPCRP